MIGEFLIFVVVVVGLSAAAGKRKAKRESDARLARTARANALLDETRAFVRKIEANQQFPAVETIVLNLPASEFVLMHEPAIPMETYQNRHIAVVEIGGVGGIGARPREWRPELDVKMTVVATGDLYLTNRRLIYVGNPRSMSLAWADLMALKTNLSILRIHTNGSDVPVAFKLNNPLLWGMIIKWMCATKIETRALPLGARIEINPIAHAEAWIVDAVVKIPD